MDLKLEVEAFYLLGMFRSVVFRVILMEVVGGGINSLLRDHLI